MKERARPPSTKAEPDPSPKIFISHASTDLWIARQIAKKIVLCGAKTFLDEGDIAHGDDFDDEILEAEEQCTELLVLLTP